MWRQEENAAPAGVPNRFAPVDEFTGVPLPILPVKTPATELIDRAHVQEFCRYDEHHAMFQDADLKTEAERVLRHARVQLGPRWAHGKYHQLYDRVAISRDVHKQFRLALMLTAQFIPDEAIDVRDNHAERVEIPLSVRQQMLHETIRPERRLSPTTGVDINRANRGIYFMQYALDQNFAGLGIESLLTEFLETDDQRRRLRVGYRIFDVAFAHASGDMEDLYTMAHQRGYIHPAQPNSPLKLVRKIVHGHQPNYFGFLRERIIADVA